MRRILGIETATDACSCALWCEGEVTERFEIAPRRQAERVLPMIDELLKEKQLTVADMDAIAFGQGPGSFMGTRLAASVAMGLAFGVDKPVIPVSSLHSLAQRAYQESGEEQVAAAWDARMNEVYWGCYRAENGRMQPVLNDALDKPAAVILPKGKWLLVGNAWEVYRPEFTFSQDSRLFYPSAAMVVVLALSLKSQEAHQLDLCYLRQEVAHRHSGKN